MCRAAGLLFLAAASALAADGPAAYDGPLLVIRRKADGGHMGLPQNWQGNCALPAFGYDNEIAILSNGVRTTVHRPESGAFVGDVDLNFDGDRMLFSMPDGKGAWHVWEVRADGSGLRRLTPEEPQADHYDACYLPDDGIVFASTMVFQGVPCVGGGNAVANLFHRSADGTRIRRLCFDQDHDWCPTVLNDGRVMYTRWEYTDTPHYFTRLLFQMNPDGTGQSERYGSNSYWPNSIFYARPFPGHPTRLVAIVSGHHGVARAGELVVFDPARGRREAEGAVLRIGSGGPPAPVIKDRLVDDVWPRYLHPYPLDDERILVSCQPDSRSPWGIYVVDLQGRRTKVAEEPGYALLEPIPLRPSMRPPVIPDRVRVGEKTATVRLTDVYAGEGLRGVPRGTVKQLRVFAYHFAYNRMGGHIDIGVDGPWDARRILGIVPVEEDGSAAFVAPANTPLAVQPLDAGGQAIQVMRSWFTAMPGEQVSCMGCHESQNAGPALRAVAADRRPPRAIDPWLGPERPFSFAREVQPVLDRRCVGCHDGSEGAGKAPPDFRGDLPDATPAPIRERRLVRGFDAAYLALHPYVRRPGPESDYHLPKPYEYHASSSELVQMLRAGHHGVALDAEDWDRLVTWIDLNVPDHGTWGEQRPIPDNYAAPRRETQRKYAGVDLDPEAYPVPLPLRAAFVPPVPPPPDEPLSATGPGAFPAGVERTLVLDLGGGLRMELQLVPGTPPFYLGRCEVQNAQYRLFDPAHDSGYTQIFNKDRASRGVPCNGDRQPAVRVTWDQARDFCAWMSARTGRRVRLPTAEEWELACRGGTDTPMWYGQVGDDFSAYANLADLRLRELCVRDSPPWLPAVATVDDRSCGLAEVGRYQPNPWGLCDMHGNAAEWTASSAGGQRVVRGGSYYDRPHRATVTASRGYLPFQPVFDVGFRVAVDAGGGSTAEAPRARSGRP